MSLFRLFIRTSALTACVLFLAFGVRAQYRAGIQGVVQDPSGAIVSGATVTVTAQETGISQVVTTGEDGVYSVTRLAPGLYTITAEKKGFHKNVISDVNIVGEQITAVNVGLQVGEAAQIVTVNGNEIPALDTEDGQISGTITANQIQKMPSYGRDIFNLVQLAPGTLADASRNGSGDSTGLPSNEQAGSGASDAIFKTENGVQVSANGGRTNQNNIQIDGVGVTSVSWGGASVITPNEDSVKEVKVVANNYDAENGRFSGGQVQIISANGTNEFHGSAFIKLDRPGLNAYQSYNGPGTGTGTAPYGHNRDTARFNQIGGSLGGPIWKNHIFAFFSYETVRENSTNTSNAWYETPQLLALAPTGSIAAKFGTYPGEAASFTQVLTRACSDIGLVQGVNCNQVSGGLNIGSPLTSPLGTADPTYQSQLNPGIGSGLTSTPDLMYAATTSPSITTEEQYHGRLDWDVTKKDLLAFSLYRVPVSSQFYNGPVRAANLWNHTAINEAETLLWDHTFSPTLINEVRVNAAGWRWNEITSNNQEPWGLPQDNIDNIGTATNNGQFLGAPGPSVFDQWTYGAKDVLTKVYQGHTVKFGAEYTRLLFVDEAPWSARPSYNFRNYWDFLNDAPYVENGTFDPVTGIPASFRKDTRETLVGLFVQDNYKVRSNLTFTFGLRWDYFGPMAEKNGNLGNVNLGTGADVLTGLSVTKGGNQWQSSGNNFGPQVGFAWSPKSAFSHDFNSKLVVRGGFGIGYNALEEAITVNARNNPPFVSSNSSLTGSQILYAVPADIHDFNGYPSNPYGITGFNASGLPATGAVISLTGIQPNLPTSYTYHYSADVQYDFGHQWIATLGYQGSMSRHLTIQTNLNFVYAQAATLNPQVNNLDWYENEGNAQFNAFYADIRHQFNHGFEFDGRYQYSKCYDDGSNNFAINDYPYNPSTAWGPCDYDLRNFVKLWGVWSPRFFHGDHAWIEKIVGGWSLSGILNWHTGFPWTPTYNTIDGQNTCNLLYTNGACSNGTTANLRPAAYLGGAGSDYSNSTFEKQGGNFPLGGNAYFTAPTFTTGPDFPGVGPVQGAPGVSRNSFWGPRYFDVDATLVKSFGLPKMKILGEGAAFEIRANFYNLFNNLNLNGVGNQIDTNINDPNFGMPLSALAGRTIEFQGRFSF